MTGLTNAPLTTVLGAATAAYGAAVLVQPRVMTSPLDLEDAPATRALTRAVGARDVVSGLAVALAPPGWPRRVALLARIAADTGDAVVLGGSLFDPGARAKAAAGAGGWGLVNAVALALDLRRS